MEITKTIILNDIEEKFLKRNFCKLDSKRVDFYIVKMSFKGFVENKNTYKGKFAITFFVEDEKIGEKLKKAKNILQILKLSKESAKKYLKKNLDNAFDLEMKAISIFDKEKIENSINSLKEQINFYTKLLKIAN